jgi:predicted transcriptional regulator
MREFYTIITGQKHSLVGKLVPVLMSLDEEFGQENVLAGRYCTAKNHGERLILQNKGYDNSRQAYTIQAKICGKIQYFHVKIPEDSKQRIDDFIKSCCE